MTNIFPSDFLANKRCRIGEKAFGSAPLLVEDLFIRRDTRTRPRGFFSPCRLLPYPPSLLELDSMAFYPV